MQTVSLPIPQEDPFQPRMFAHIYGFKPYFAMSTDGEYYLELDEAGKARCTGKAGYPYICSPVHVMYSVRTRPSCVLALYTGNVTMMKKTCKKEYSLQRTQEQIFQIGQTAELLITAAEGQFIRHCSNGGQMVSIDACELCTITLPCGCILRSDEVMLPPLLDNCKNLTEYREIGRAHV